MYKFRWVLLLVSAVCLTTGCMSSERTSKKEDRSASAHPADSLTANRFTLSVQKAPPRTIQSIQLYRKDHPTGAPVIELDSDQKLVLEFDHLGAASRQYRIKVDHYNKNWEPSPLPPDFYLSGFSETYFSNGRASFSREPSYRHYTYEFPNSRLSFKASGNYLLSVYSYDSNELLFSLPFFVSEDIGSLETRIESLFAARRGLRTLEQPFSRYQYPAFVQFPGFDLSFMYVQNQFWGRARLVDIVDTAAPGRVRFHLGREEAFLGDYEFNTLNLGDLSPDGRNILDIRREFTPPRVILRRDVQAFDTPPPFSPDVRFGYPSDDRSASYAEVAFRLETSRSLPSDTKVYIVGDFNNWMVNEHNRMQFNRESGLWEGHAVIKQGEYAYKYVIVENGSMDDISLDKSFSFTRQSYLTLVYFRDPSRNYDRLLKAEQTRGNL